jgi:hypothetical protein
MPAAADDYINAVREVFAGMVVDNLCIVSVPLGPAFECQDISAITVNIHFIRV